MVTQQRTFPQLFVVVWFHLLLLITPFAFTWVNEELFEFNKMIITYAITVLIVGTWLIRMVIERRIVLSRTRLDIFVTLFFISQVISTVLSMHPRTSFFGYYTRFHGGLLSTITYIALYYAFVSNVTLKHLKGLFLTAFIAAVGVSLYAIPEHFGYSPSCFLILGSNDIEVNGWQHFWQTFVQQPSVFLNVSCWVQTVQYRIFGTFGQPNWLAAYAITLIPLGIALAVSSLSKKLRFFYSLSVVILGFVLLYTKSRSGFLGIMVGLTVFVIGYIWWWWQHRLHVKSQMLQLIVLPFILMAFCGALIFSNLATAELTKWFKYFNTAPNTNNTEQLTTDVAVPIADRLEVGGTDSGEIRKIVWEGAWKVWQRYPLFGSGVETFAYSYYQDRPLAHNTVSEWDFLYNKAHNEFLNYLATTGIVGLGTYLLLFSMFGITSTRLFVHYSLLKSNQTDAKNELLILGIISGVIALTISNFFGFSTVMVTILMFLYMAIVEIMYPSREAIKLVQTKPKLSSLSLTNSDYSLIILLSLVCLYILFIINTMWQADRLFNQGDELAIGGQLIESANAYEQAIRKSPQEALYYDKLSSVYAQLAVGLMQVNETTLSAQIVQESIKTSDMVMQLNPVHLNFYKTRAHVFLVLSQLNPQFLNSALSTLAEAQKRAPTDAKIVYHMSLITLQMGEQDESVQLLEQAVSMRPTYEQARMTLAEQYLARKQTDLAKEQYDYILQYINPNNNEVMKQLELLTQPQ